VEVYSPDTSDEQIRAYGEMAAKLGLSPTGGSDFHAPGRGGREIGYYREGTPIPEIRIPGLV